MKSNVTSSFEWRMRRVGCAVMPDQRYLGGRELDGFAY